MKTDVVSISVLIVLHSIHWQHEHKKTYGIRESANVKGSLTPCLTFPCQQLYYLFSYPVW